MDAFQFIQRGSINGDLLFQFPVYGIATGSDFEYYPNQAIQVSQPDYAIKPSQFFRKSIMGEPTLNRYRKDIHENSLD